MSGIFLRWARRGLCSAAALLVAASANAQPAPSVPTLSSWGKIALVVGLLGAAYWTLRSKGDGS